ncbi:MAG: hydrogenase formation protein HypD [Deltaproteobacteria bacterium]|nr:hydrogenase formation protein HypD [Deltaproteobacteria bacterium]
MIYLNGFRDPLAAAALRARIADSASRLSAERGPVRLMEVCGSHTMAIARSGIKAMLPSNVELISGPGCPVCVTAPGYVDTAVEMARRGAAIVTFGDMVRVPGTSTTLAKERARGATVHVCYSPAEAIAHAQNEPDREHVFLAIGFETTAPAVTAVMHQAATHGIPNLSFLTAFKLVPPALQALMNDPDVALDAFLCPAHVSAIIGADAYRPFAAQGTPCVVAGFEPLDILDGVEAILRQMLDGRSFVENRYSRVVKDGGNARAQELMARYLRPIDASWRGLGTIPESGLGLRPEFSTIDAEVRFGLPQREGKPNPKCLCGDVLKGKIRPAQCPLFGTVCTPIQPMGPCMVSSEGSCAAEYRYAKGAA